MCQSSAGEGCFRLSSGPAPSSSLNIHYPRNCLFLWTFLSRFVKIAINHNVIMRNLRCSRLEVDGWRVLDGVVMWIYESQRPWRIFVGLKWGWKASKVCQAPHLASLIFWNYLIAAKTLRKKSRERQKQIIPINSRSLHWMFTHEECSHAHSKILIISCSNASLFLHLRQQRNIRSKYQHVRVIILTTWNKSTFWKAA